MLNKTKQETLQHAQSSGQFLNHLSRAIYAHGRCLASLPKTADTFSIRSNPAKEWQAEGQKGLT